ncbi:hypothetical protein PENTCL1PPCAC_22276 [Pristionchus entomophagus]|uniref:DNA-directed DNA polymerase n=1 Tax=Pristionchus entomophagus TaxID=358040 RepID=A0AAV5U0W7_9BILA|nr:hypothetical protein PENTCL1PPCAC_22276 [Pristionchus entomophagus]
MKLKFQASGFPVGVNTDQEKEEYCARVGEKVGFVLRPDEVVKSTSLRTVSKFCCNSCRGKLAEVPMRATTEFLTVEECEKLHKDGSRIILDIKPLSDDMLVVVHKPRVETVRANRYSAVHHAVFVTAYSRVLLYSLVKKVGRRAAYMDTDSIVFEMRRDEEDPLAHLLTGELGDLTDEIKEGCEIDEAVFAGCKNYSMEIVNKETKEVETKQALRGFTKDVNAARLLAHAEIEKQVFKHSDEPFISVVRQELKRTMGKIYTGEHTKKWRCVSIKNIDVGEGKPSTSVHSDSWEIVFMATNPQSDTDASPAAKSNCVVIRCSNHFRVLCYLVYCL